MKSLYGKRHVKKRFDELKRNLTLALVLTIPSGLEGYTVYCDASRQSLGGVLMQHENVIAYDLKAIEKA